MRIPPTFLRRAKKIVIISILIDLLFLLFAMRVHAQQDSIKFHKLAPGDTVTEMIWGLDSRGLRVVADKFADLERLQRENALLKRLHETDSLSIMELNKQAAVRLEMYNGLSQLQEDTKKLLDKANDQQKTPFLKDLGFKGGLAILLWELSKNIGGRK